MHLHVLVSRAQTKSAPYHILTTDDGARSFPTAYQVISAKNEDDWQEDRFNMTHHINVNERNPFSIVLKNLGLWKTKLVTEDLILRLGNQTEHLRLQMLAGLLNTDGCLGIDTRRGYSSSSTHVRTVCYQSIWL